jgi:hypothetical protein
MKNFLTKKITFYSSIVLFFFLNLIWIRNTFAAPVCVGQAGKLQYCLLEGEAFKGFGIEKANDLGTFLNAAFQFGLALAAALAVIMIIWGGVEVMLSESMFSKDEGKKRIREAVIGLLLALFSWLILNIINPDILNFKL